MASYIFYQEINYEKQDWPTFEASIIGYYLLGWNCKANDVLKGEPDDEGGLSHLEEPTFLIVVVVVVFVLGDVASEMLE